RAEQIASMAAMPALAAAAAGVSAVSGAGASAGAGGPSIASWLRTGISKVALAPLSVDRMPIGKRAPSPLDDAEDSKPYALAQPEGGAGGRVRMLDTVVVRVWRRELGSIQKVFRWLNESAYFVSIPFIMILLFGTAVKNRPMALFGATFVVLL